MPELLRVVHISSGIAGMSAGIVAFLARKGGRLHARIGVVYFALVTICCLSAAMLTLDDLRQSWPFMFVAVATYAFAVVGFLARRRRLMVHVVGLTSSFAGMAIASVVNNFQRVTGIRVSFAARMMPMQLLATCVVVWVGVLVYRGKIPRRYPS